MRLTCIALGSRGDVQPYIALCAELRLAGHQVRLATHGEFAPLIRARDIEFHDVGSDPRTLLESELAHTMMASGNNPVRFLRTFGKVIEPILEESVRQSRLAVQDADGVINGNAGILAHRLSQGSVPYCSVCLQPFTPTSAYPAPCFPELPGGRFGYNLLSHHLFLAIFWQFMGRLMWKTHQRMGLPLPDRQTSRKAWRDGLICYAYSPTLIPAPEELPANHHVTGFCFLDEASTWQAPAELEDFLAAGPPPIYIGFGSMRNKRPEETAELVIAALQQTGQRGVLLKGWGGMQQSDLPDNILLVDSVPHDWLFPRMRAVVHHGGAGTTAAGLRAGVPAIIIPYFADQPFWARTCYHAGVAARPIPRARLTVQRLADALRAVVNDAPMRTHAAELGRRISAEDGARKAAGIIEAYFER